MNTEGKHIWAALCKAGATEEDRAEAADQRAQADEEKAEAERNIAESDQLKEGASIRAALGFPKDALWPSEAATVVTNAVIQHQNSQTMSEEDEAQEEEGCGCKHADLDGQALRDALGFPRQAYGMDRYPSRRIPRNWRPPEHDGSCDDDDYLEEWESDFKKTCYEFLRKNIVNVLKKRGWQVTNYGIDEVSSDVEEGASAFVEATAKAGQKIGLGGRKTIVLDKNIRIEEDDLFIHFLPVEDGVEFEGSEQFDVDEFAEWTYESECPTDDIEEVTYDGTSFKPTPQGALKLLDAWNRDWIQFNNVRSKIKRKAMMKEGQAIRDALGFPKEAGRFNLGRVVQTRGVNSKSRENRAFGREVMDAFRKYQRGNWGDTERDSVKRNNAVVKDGVEDQIFAVYDTSEGKIYIITEWDGSVTTILFSHEY